MSNLLTIDEYYTVAKKILRKKKQGSLIKNIDALDYMVRYMMKSDSTYDSSKAVKGTPQGRRGVYAMYGLKTYLSIRKKKKLTSFDFSRIACKEEKTNTDIHEMVNILPDKMSKNKDMLIRYYQDKQTLKDIAEVYNISQERVRQRLKAGILFLRKYLKNPYL
jgi:RNA polymerase sigma factor (sigma-70 family)